MRTLGEHIELLFLLIVDNDRYYEQDERGGNVLHGAMMGLLSADSGEGLMALGGSLKTGAKLAVQSVIGGTLSELGGGNFANGAITAAFSFMFNDVMHDNDNSEDSDSDFEVEIEVPIDVESQPSQLTEILAGATLILIADDGTVIGL